MSAAGKRRGSQFERDLLDWFRNTGMDAERLRLVGKLDEGDIAVRDVGITYVIEAKNVQRVTLADFVDQAVLEASHFASARRLGPEKVMPLAVIKRRGKGIGDSFVVTTANHFFGEDFS